MTRLSLTLALLTALAACCLLGGCAAEPAGSNDDDATADGAQRGNDAPEVTPTSPSAQGIDRSVARHARQPTYECEGIHPLKTPQGPVPDPWRAASSAPEPPADPGTPSDRKRD